MTRDPQDSTRSVRIIRRRGAKQGRVAVEIEMTARDWVWMEELEDRRMIPLPDMLYSGFFQGMEREGWNNPDHVTTPAMPPSGIHALRNNTPGAEKHEAEAKIIQLPLKRHSREVDDDIPF